MTLSKWQALGNDYLLVERAELPAPADAEIVSGTLRLPLRRRSDGLLEVAAGEGARAEVRDLESRRLGRRALRQRRANRRGLACAPLWSQTR